MFKHWMVAIPSQLELETISLYVPECVIIIDGFELNRMLLASYHLYVTPEIMSETATNSKSFPLQPETILTFGLLFTVRLNAILFAHWLLLGKNV